MTPVKLNDTHITLKIIEKAELILIEGLSQSTFLQSAASCQKFTILGKKKYFVKFVYAGRLKK